ncbi:MAG: TVP38/TMEM64 family protein [Trueperaceae bacterium]|nr:TVP38/TMEM64 family protein [Trueperaceae bacterium]
MSPETSLQVKPSFLQAHWQKLLAALFWLVAIILYVVYTQTQNLSPLASLRQLIGFLSESMLGPLIFIALYIVRPLFLFSAGLLSIASGVLFGPFWGVVYTVIGSNLGASLAYLIGRFFGDGLINLKESEQGLGKYLKRLRENSFETVFIMRLIFLPYDLVNYLAGFLKVNYAAFILATALGSLPGTISFALFGASTGFSEGSPKFDWRVLLASVIIFALSLVISRLVKRKEQRA